MIELIYTLWHFAMARWILTYTNPDHKKQKFVQWVRQQSTFYARGSDEIPIIEKQKFLEHFEEFNRFGIRIQDATQLALRAEQDRNFKPTLKGGVTVGLSSGTSGKRHVFLVDRWDRCRWAGKILGRLLTTKALKQIFNPFDCPLRIAFFLRANSNLYTTLSGRRTKFVYFDLTRPFSDLIQELKKYQPHVLVAPATVMAELAKQCRTLKPSQVISVAEVLDDRDRQTIVEAFKVRVDEIYQAAEGFLGYTCLKGRMHLNEEFLHVEPMWIDGKKERFHPIITDFTRKTQWIVRYKLDDILLINPKPCPCGRKTKTLKSIIGRADEVLWLPSLSGERLAPIFPDVLRKALYSVSRAPTDYLIEQYGLRWVIRLQGGDAECVFKSLVNMMDELKITHPEFQIEFNLKRTNDIKKRRIRCHQKPS